MFQDEQKNLKREYKRAQEEVKRIQSVPLVIGMFLKIISCTMYINVINYKPCLLRNIIIILASGGFNIYESYHHNLRCHMVVNQDVKEQVH